MFCRKEVGVLSKFDHAGRKGAVEKQQGRGRENVQSFLG